LAPLPLRRASPTYSTSPRHTPAVDAPGLLTLLCRKCKC
jgi:hypothetical protein